MNRKTLKETIQQELPELLHFDPDFEYYVPEITRGKYANRQETRNWFHKTIYEMPCERVR